MTQRAESANLGLLDWS